MKKTLAIAFTALLTVVLSGCMRMHIDLVLEEGDTASGSMIFAISDETAQSMQMEPQALFDIMMQDSEEIAPEDGKAEPYAADGYTGTKWTFESQPIEANVGGGSDLTITREGDDYVVSGEFNMGDEGEMEGNAMAEAMLQGFDVALKITFPGEIKEANGEITGQTVTWAPKPGENLTLSARGSAIGTGSGAGGLSLPVILGIVGAVLVLVVVAIIVAGSRKRGGNGSDGPDYTAGGASFPPAGGVVPGGAAVPNMAPGGAPNTVFTGQPLQPGQPVDPVHANPVVPEPQSPESGYTQQQPPQPYTPEGQSAPAPYSPPAPPQQYNQHPTDPQNPENPQQ